MSGIVSIHNRLYTYYDLERDLQDLALLSGFHGMSFAWSNIRSATDIFLRIHGTKGFTKHAVVIQAAMHAREWKNAQLLMMMQTFSSLLWGGYSLGGDSISAIAAAL